MTEISEAASATADPGRPGNKVLAKMLDRLMAVLVNGPSLNCRPHNSRQRIDFAQFHKLGDIAPEAALEKLLGDGRKVTVKARVPQPKRRTKGDTGDSESTEADSAASAAETAAEKAWADQNALLNKLHTVAEDARTYEQDTGVHVLNVGFPLLSLPPGSAAGAAGRGATRRILAPVAFIPVTLTVKRGSPRAIELACRGEGVDLIIPNAALLSWIEQQTGKAAAFSESAERADSGESGNGKVSSELFSDDAGEDPWREVRELTRFVCSAMEIEVPEFFAERYSRGGPGSGLSEPQSTEKTRPLPSPEVPVEGNEKAGELSLALSPAPHADESADGAAILCSAILGLFPMANQGLLRDTQAMVAQGPPPGLVRNFVRVGLSLDAPAAAASSGAGPEGPTPAERRRRREFAAERFIADADPCQSRAVRLARESAGLVVHGPPGTGKSQTITNIIGDHLARGQRVLLVCEKRTALDVVANRLRHMGLGGLIAIVHDPRRDQRELYRTLRQQLDDLSGAPIDDGAAGKLKKVDSDLQKLHDELTEYHAALTRIDAGEASPDAAPFLSLSNGPRRSAQLAFHDLVGQWLDTMPAARAGPYPQLDPLTADKVSALGLSDLTDRLDEIEEKLRRAESVGWAGNPWRDAATADLTSFLTRNADAHRSAVRGCVEPARASDATLMPLMPAFAPGVNLKRQADARVDLAEKLASLLESANPRVLAHWAARPFTAARAARAALTDAGPYVEVFRSGPLDADLLAAASRIPQPAPATVAAQVTALQKYADAYSEWSGRLDGIMKKAPGVPPAVIAAWVLSEATTAEAGRNRLDAAAPLAGRCASPPLDAELLPVYRRQPFGLPQLLRWLSALETYLQTASTWHAFFHFSRRREATPIAHFFGLPLSAAAGTRIRDFLASIRLRLEVREALDAALGQESEPDLEDDKSMLRSFADHHAAVTATVDLNRGLVPASARSWGQFTNINDLVNRLIPAEHAVAEPILLAYGLSADAVSASRLRTFLRGLGARRALQKLHRNVLGGEGDTAAAAFMTDAELGGSLRTHTALLDLILQVHTDQLLGGAVPTMPLPSPPPEYMGREKTTTNLTGSPSPGIPREGELQSERRRGALSHRPEPEPRGTAAEAAPTPAHVYLFGAAASTPSPGIPGEGWGGGSSSQWARARSLIDAFTHALANPNSGSALVDVLRRSPARAAAVLSLEATLSATRLFDPAWLGAFDIKLRSNQPAGPTFDDLIGRVETLESVVRVRAGVARLPVPLPEAVAALMEQSADAETGTAVLRHAALEGEIARRLATSPILQEIDGRRIEASFDRYHKLVERKQQLVRDAILVQWVGRQKERLLSGTGSRLNALGAELRRRLTLRGERAMRLRRVIEVGRRTPGGDPLLDLCPIWMVSPETVAQIFSREPIFDAVVFDEASQCRLEEALPVVTRGSRVVIAGDPQQLTPSRFFESAITLSDDEDPQTDQELFETQQAEVEDLLGAALGLDIRHCYLDVHYRSRSDELIAFSNEHFYHNRLQPIPRHPARVRPFAPVTLYHVGGVYDKRRNEAEADRVCQIVKELLSVKRDPPSIGVACFNLPQRDLIVERLEEMASDDAAFAKKLDEARRRAGAGSFEGLFVKNLENVQGDERDHIIISTTYGPDKSGRFYRRFGPVGLPGGGRRLNVLVTRARDRVHLVTSVPAEAYRHLPPPPPGQTPGGGWLLFAYLRYAESLGTEIASRNDASDSGAKAWVENGTDRHGEPSEQGAIAAGVGDTEVQVPLDDRGIAKPRAADLATFEAQPHINPTRAPSIFAEAMARRLAADRNIPSHVYWGNDGFCVDLLLHDPVGGVPPSAAVLCDAARYPAAEDPMEWDIFRSTVLEAQGWRLHRLWSPHVYRDPAGAVAALSQLIAASSKRAGGAIA